MSLPEAPTARAVHTPPGKVRSIPGRASSRTQLIDRLFFFAGTVAAVWLAVALITVSLRTWWGIGLIVVFWLVLAYLALPRLNRILTAIYVPDYFIGRTRTSDGLLGDPLNLAFRGSPEQVATALHRAKWIQADPINFKSTMGIIGSTLTRRSYAAAPVSPLLLFGRGQDAAFQQEVDGNPAQRHHMRIWQTPDGWLLPGGHRVDWLADGSYDRRVGLSLFTLQVTHKIDADIDVERDYIIHTVKQAEPSTLVEPLTDFTTSYHSRNGGGDDVHTDGTLPIVDLGDVEPDPDVPPVGPSTRISRPLTVLVPSVLALLGAVAAATSLPAELHTTRDEVAQGATWVGAALAVIIAVLAVLTLRRSSAARKALLIVAFAELAARVTTFYATEGTHARILAIAHSLSPLLVLVGLSSTSARQWSEREVPDVRVG